jgi:hypothetical protein
MPLHVPPDGEYPLSCVGIGWLQRLMSGPAFTIGNGFTVTVLVVVFVHPLVAVPVTVYVVVEVGLTTIGFVFGGPLDHE